MWLIILSDQLPIVALVGFYPTNQLIGRRLVHQREARRSPAFLSRAYAVLAWVSPGCPPLVGQFLRFPHPSATRALLPPFDLHVLGMPPAFNLSQDQTLQFNSDILPIFSRVAFFSLRNFQPLVNPLPGAQAPSSITASTFLTSFFFLLPDGSKTATLAAFNSLVNTVL